MDKTVVVRAFAFFTLLCGVFMVFSYSPSAQVTPENLLPSESRLFSDLPEIQPYGSANFIQSVAGEVRMSQNRLVPGTYILGPGDVFNIKIIGIVDEEYKVAVNSRGVLAFGKVQSFLASGLSLEEARERITEEVMKEYQNVMVETEIVDLKNIDIVVTGNARNPGIFTLRGNATFLDLMFLCGGPTGGGSYREITLTRNLVQPDGSTRERTFSVDLYNAFLFGTHTKIMLESGDIVHIPPITNVTTIFGQIKRSARFEWSDSMTLRDLIGMGGGFSPNAAINYIEIQRTKGMDEYIFMEVDYQDPEVQMMEIEDGDIIRVPDRLEIIAKENILCNINGRVHFPGRYYLPKGSTLSDLIQAAGGLKEDAFFHGLYLSRDPLNAAQERVMQKVVRDVQSRLFSMMAETAESAVLNDDIKLLTKAQNLRQNTIQSLGTVLYNGRLIFNPDELDPVLHNSDSVSIPTQPNSVTVLGAVFNSGSFSYQPNLTLQDYLRLVGGASPYADQSKMFIIKSYGVVIEAAEKNNPIEDGDTIVIPFDYNLLFATDSTDSTGTN